MHGACKGLELDAREHRSGERTRERAAGLALVEPARTQIEEGGGIELTRGRTVIALDIVGVDLVREVMPPEKFEWTTGLSPLSTLALTQPSATGTSPHVVAIDYGMKWNILRHLRANGCRVTVMPGTATAADVLNLKPDGVFLSNGPGDPRPLDYAIGTIRGLIGQVPVFGICLGHQLMGLAWKLLLPLVLVSIFVTAVARAWRLGWF